MIRVPNFIRPTPFDVQVLSELKQSEKRAAYILMNRIISSINRNCIIRSEANDTLVFQDVVSELGIFGVIIGYNVDSTLYCFHTKIRGHEWISDTVFNINDIIFMSVDRTVKL